MNPNNLHADNHGLIQPVDDTPSDGAATIESETMYFVYARQIGTSEWYPQESSLDEADVLRWRERNNATNSREYELGCGREFIAVRRVSKFEVIA